VDDRGYLEHEGPIVSIMAGQTITVRLLRLHMAQEAMSKLSLVSTNERVVKIVGRTTDKMGEVVKLSGVPGSMSNNPEMPKEATIEVRYGGVKGPLVHRLSVQVYNPIEVAVAVHFVPIGQRNNEKIAPILPSLKRAEFEKIIDKINITWRAAGVRLHVTKWLTDAPVYLTTAGAMTSNGSVNEFDDVTRNRQSQHMNLYVVDSMIGGGIGWGAAKTALVAADQKHGDQPSTPDALANVFAHEVGHFLGLWHPATRYSEGDNIAVTVTVTGKTHTERHNLEDLWSCRMLMYGYTRVVHAPYLLPLADDTRQRGRYSDIGNSQYVGGKMLCCKTVPKIVSSFPFSEIVTARKIALLYPYAQPKGTTTGWLSPNSKSGQGVFA
jgi:hypothetical protein